MKEYEKSHPDFWELHPNSDEIIFLMEGKLRVECSTISGSKPEYDSFQNIKRITVYEGQSIIIPKGHLHRLLLLEPSKIIVMAKIKGTEHIQVEDSYKNVYNTNKSNYK